MKTALLQSLGRALNRAMDAGDLPRAELGEVLAQAVVERPKATEHGDLACNLAMQGARVFKMPPRKIAEALITHLGDMNGLLERAEIAGPGFINFFLKPTAWLSMLPAVLDAGEDYGRSEAGAGVRVLVEFVSANPTGPLHVGHGRGAALGDALARLLSFAGFAVASEYYINDAGNQMATLGRSLLARARQARGSDEQFPENHYRGDYMKELAEEFLAEQGDEVLAEDKGESALELASQWAGNKILQGIKDDLSAFKVRIDDWFSERSLFEPRNGLSDVDQALKELDAGDRLKTEDGALWFKATEFGDEKDRVVRRSNGELTYFASDIAYHLNKHRRGFARLIDVWGADHHGYVPRLKAAMAALGQEPDGLTVVLVQMVNLLRAGEPVAMSTRAGEFVTLREVIDEVGADAARFIFLTRRSEAPLDFDLALAKQKSLDNPVYYVQYAHTRVMSILRKAAETGVALPDPAATDLGRLDLEEEVALARRLAEWPETAAGAAQALEPHRLTYYLHELAGSFHSYYNAHRVLVDDAGLCAARLVLAQAVGVTLRAGLNLLGVDAPETM